MARQMIDDVVVYNRSRNPEVYYELSSMPIYGCEVRDASKDVIKLDSVSSKDASKLGIMEIIRVGVENFTLEPGDGTVVLLRENNEEPENVKVSPIVVKLLKVATAASFSQNEDYCYVLSELVKQILENVKNITLPLSLPKNNKTQEVLSAELNDVVKELFDKYDVPYSAILDTTKGVNKLLKAAEASNV